MVDAAHSNDGWGETVPASASDSVLSEEEDDSLLREIAASPRRVDAIEPNRRGQRIAHYQVGEKLGQGGMGVVYSAEDVRLRRKVALKVLPLHLVAKEDRRRRFLREARSASAVQHANLATIFDVGEDEGTVYLAMELVEGRTLRVLLRERGRLPRSEAVAVVLQLARGVARAHEVGVIHRDIKPENVMISSDGTAKLLDFGLAKLSGNHEDLPVQEPEGGREAGSTSRIGRVMGTAGYMSPEQAEGVAVDKRTDIYALGVVLYELVTGSRPPRSLTPTLQRELLKQELLLQPLIVRCLAPSPADRYEDGRALAAALVVVDRSLTELNRAQPKRSLYVLAFAGLSAAGGLTLWALDRERTDPNPTPTAPQIEGSQPQARGSAGPEPGGRESAVGPAAAATVAPSSSSAASTVPPGRKILPFRRIEPTPSARTQATTSSVSSATGLQRAVATGAPF